ncbi:MAG: glycosyltransferase family 2 protein [Planctomycetota bacterium]
MDLSVILVSYNTRELTLTALASLREQTVRTDFETIVLDNASTDGSADAIALAEPGVKLIRSEENLGFAQGNNEAAKRATGKLLLLLNPDTVVLDSAVDRLVEFADAHPERRIWGGRTLFGDESLNPASCHGKITLWSLMSQALGLSSVFRESGLFNPEGLGGWDRGTEREVDIVSGCFFLIDRKLWDQLGGFDRLFFMYGEEADLCHRARTLGAKPTITPDATIVHYGGASERVREDKLVRLLKAKTDLIRRHLRPFPRLGVGLLTLWPLTRALAWTLLAPLKGERGRESASAWRSVFSRRREWMERRDAA